MNRICMAWLLAVLTAIAFASGPNNSSAADEKAGARNAQPDHPLGLVAFASIDRVKARAESLADALGQAGEGEKLLISMVGGDQKAFALLNSPGMDPTRPIGAMCFPQWLSGKGDEDEAKEPEFEFEDFFDNPLELLVGGSASMFVQNSTLVICFPYKDREQLMHDVARSFPEGSGRLKPIDDHPGWYQVGDEDFRIGFAHNYLLLVYDESDSPQFDRNYPDFAKLARSSLGKNGFVYALYRKGLPFLVRDVMGPAFKLAFAARFQQQDDESDIQFRLRTMTSALQMQLFDLAISHVEEFRITGHVDSTTHAVLIEPEIVGPKGGKLAKYFNDGKGFNSVFANQPTEDADFVASMSMSLPAKDWKPTVDALYAFAQSQEQSATTELVRAFAKMIEAGQFEFYTYNPTWERGLIAVRHNGGTQFADQIQELLKDHLFDTAVDTVDGVSIHRISTPLAFSPVYSLLAVPLLSLLGHEVAVSDLGMGDDSDVPDLSKMPCVWVATTPRAIFLGSDQTKERECPDWFKTQVAASLKAPSGRSKAPLQVTLRDPFSMSGRGTLHKQMRALEDGDQMPDGTTYVKPAAAKAQPKDDAREDFNRKVLEDNQAREKARSALLRDLPNAIRCEIRSTETGAKLSITLEEAYFQWFATMLKDSAEMSETMRQRPPDKIEVAPETNTRGQ